MHMPSPLSLVVILAIILLLFGGKRVADLAKGLGSGVKNFKNAVKENGEAENENIVKTEAVEEVIESKKVTPKKTTAKKTTKKV